MILSDRAIQALMDQGKLTITPLEPGQIQPASVDVRLGNTFSIVEDSPSGVITMEKEIRYKTITTDTYVLLPGQFVLATTLEYFDLPDNLTAFVEGRSSLGRMVFAEMDQPALRPYRGKYQGQRGATGSRVYLDPEAEQ